NWLTNFSGTTDDYPGVHGRTYEFEVAAHDGAGNVEAFTQEAETTTEVDTTADDVQAPGPPPTLLAGGSSPSPWQNDPQFEVAWQEPSDPSGIAAAYYKRSSMPTANFDTTGSVVSGTTLTIDATVEEGQDLFLWFADQRGNIDFRNYGTVELRYDGTLPAIFEMDFLNADFLPNWYRQSTTGTAELAFEYTEFHTNSLLMTSADLGTSIDVPNPESGEDVQVIFNLAISGKPDGFYQINFTLADSAGNVATDSTILALDSAAPTGTQASSPDTSRDLTFTVTWSGGADGSGSGLSDVYDVRVQEDGGAWQDWLTNFSGTSSDYTGINGSTYGFEAAGHDNTGNVEAFLNIAETETVIDMGFTDVLAPTIQHTPILVVDEGQDVTIQAEVADNVLVTEVLLFYKQSGVVAFQSMPMVSTAGSTYSATLTASQISVLGVNYFIRASDGANEAFDPADDYDVLPYNISVRITGTDNSGLVKDTPPPGGSSVNFYRMISVPLILADSDPIAVLADDLGPYDSKKWRLFEYITSSDSYREYPNVSPFSPNQAFWLLVRESNRGLDSGPGTSVTTSKGFEITLNQGWTDIGMPFSFPVDADNIEIVAGDPTGVIGPYTYRDGWLLPNQVPTLEPWEGYTFFSPAAGVKIAIHPVAQSTAASRTRANKIMLDSGSGPEWSVRIEASSGEITDANNFLGVAANAAAAWDRLDYLEPPFISDYVSVRFPHPDWEIVSGNFKSDVRPPFEEGQVWSFEVATSLKNSRIRLTFENLESLPRDFTAVLLDKKTYQIIDLHERREYGFLPDQEDLTRRFDLVIGTESYVENSEALDVVPETFSLSQNFPNPFNAGTTMLYNIAEASEVTVKVLNILGQEVRQLVRDRKEPGVYRVHWDGKADNGLELSSGVYFIRMQAGKFQQIRKVLFVR
ncbi:T9SS type A sorting domain-containing protein, partial [candidate division KSB1 bacterium]|nr:T9SS type A sorting domain-containing protein [candidate division KSB1 bacterium]